MYFGQHCCFIGLLPRSAGLYLFLEVVNSGQQAATLTFGGADSGAGTRTTARAIIEHQPTLKSYLDNTQNSQPKGTPFALLTFCWKQGGCRNDSLNSLPRKARLDQLGPAYPADSQLYHNYKFEIEIWL